MKNLRKLIIFSLLIATACSINYLPGGIQNSSQSGQNSQTAIVQTISPDNPVVPLDMTEPTEQLQFQSSFGTASGLHASNPVSFKLASGSIQFVEFFAYWCSDCKTMAPIVHALEEKYQGRVNFVYLDVDDSKNANTMKQLNASYFVPEFRILDPLGRTLWSYIGPTDQVSLDAAIFNSLAK